MKRLATGFAAVTFLFCLALSMGASCPKQGDAIDQGIKQSGKETFMQGEALFEAGDYEGARELYQQVIEQAPMTSWSNKAQYRMGQCYFKLGKTDEALAEFQRFVDNNRDDSDLTAAQDYIIKILENRQQESLAEYEANLIGYQQQNFRLEALNRYLRKSVDSEEIYIELDLEANRIFVKIGTQTIYEYPVVTGKGMTRLKTTGRMKNFATPKGIRQVESIEKDPVWYRPDWVWLEKGEEIPENITMEERGVPGTLGPYKVSIGDGFYIHGTRRGTIRPGKYSHGCIRMNNKELKQLVRMVEVGTMVYIY